MTTQIIIIGNGYTATYTSFTPYVCYNPVEIVRMGTESISILPTYPVLLYDWMYLLYYVVAWIIDHPLPGTRERVWRPPEEWVY